MRKLIRWLGGVLLVAVSGLAALLFFVPIDRDSLRQRLRDHYAHAVEEGRKASSAKRKELEEELQKMNDGQKV